MREGNFPYLLVKILPYNERVEEVYLRDERSKVLDRVAESTIYY